MGAANSMEQVIQETMNKSSLGVGCENTLSAQQTVGAVTITGLTMTDDCTVTVGNTFKNTLTCDMSAAFGELAEKFSKLDKTAETEAISMTITNDMSSQATRDQVYSYMQSKCGTEASIQQKMDQINIERITCADKAQLRLGNDAIIESECLQKLVSDMTSRATTDKSSSTSQGGVQQVVESATGFIKWGVAGLCALVLVILATVLAKRFLLKSSGKAAAQRTPNLDLARRFLAPKKVALDRTMGGERVDR